MAIGHAVGALAAAGDVVALSGELGAGKTQFVRGLAAGMGIDPAAVASPTFVIVHEYPAAPDRPVLVHIDAYRIHSLEDLESIGWDLTGGSELRRGAVVVIEWADRLRGTLGEDLLTVDLAHAGEGLRSLVVRGRGQWADRMDALRSSLANIIRGST